MKPRSHARRIPAGGILMLLVAATTFAATAFTATPARAATAYISDELTVPFRTGPSSGHRILKVLPAGAALEVLERDADAGFARVTTRDGAEGWVPLQYLSGEPIARDRLAAANRELERLNRTLGELRQRLEAEQSERSEAEQSRSSLSGTVSELELELADIRRVSAGAIETAAANERLTELNTRLRDEVETLMAEREQLQNNVQQRWMMIGGGLVLLGLILGLGIKARPRRSAWT